MLKHINLSNLDKSTTIPGLNRESVYRQYISLPPLNEQYRIVEKIEELFSEIENVEASLYKIKQKLEFYWQTILHYSFCGNLSKKWRAEEINRNPESLNAIHEIPIGWKWSELETHTNFIGAGSTPKGGRSIYVHNGIPFIRSQNVLHYSLNLDDVVYITNEINEKMSRTQTQINDVLLNITGASIGRCTYIPDNIEKANVNQHVCIIRTKPTLLYKYLSLYLNSPAIQRLIQEWSSGATREALTLSQIRSIPIPMCSLEEQEYIVSELESQYSNLEHIRKMLENKINQIQMLKQSVLNKAFDGRLVPQDPNDEPAYELLKRIKEERFDFAQSKPKEKKVKINTEKMERTKSVLDLLKEAKEPVSAKEIWQQSKHWESIDDFYAELKSISDSIEQTKSKTEILLSLKK
ncbi:MAG: Type-1 restriction enzyme EcoKI specificity protein [Parabacteroides sp.]